MSDKFTYKPQFNENVTTTVDGGTPEPVNREYCLTQESAQELAPIVAIDGVAPRIFMAWPLFNRTDGQQLGATQSEQVPWFDFIGERVEGPVFDEHGAPLAGIQNAGQVASAWLRHPEDGDTALKYAMDGINNSLKGN